MNKAVVMLSGGLDSTTAAAVAKRDFSEVHAISFDYGQRHNAELSAAVNIASQLELTSHTIFNIPLNIFGGSALTDKRIDVPSDRDIKEISTGIPITYVPGRNIIFLSIAAALAEVRDCQVIVTGFTQVDYSGYPDCRTEFTNAFVDMLNIGMQSGAEGKKWSIITPLMNQSKSETIKLGISLGVDYKNTVSCYQAEFVNGMITSCGICDSCILRKKGFKEAGVEDPTIYRST